MSKTRKNAPGEADIIDAESLDVDPAAAAAAPQTPSDEPSGEAAAGTPPDDAPGSTDSDQPAAPPPDASPPPQIIRKGGGGLALFVALLALVALAFEGAWRPYLTNILPPVEGGADEAAIAEAVAPVASEIDQLSARLAALADRPSAPDLSADVAALETRLAGLAQDNATLRRDLASVQAAVGETEALDALIAEMEAQQAAMEARVAALDPLAERISGRLEALETRLSDARSAQQARDLLSATVADLQAGLTALQAEARSLGQRLDRRFAELESAQQAAGIDREAIRSDLRTRLASLSDALEDAEAAREELAGELAAITINVEAGTGGDRRAEARLLAVARLAAKLATEERYAAELAAARALSAEDAEIMAVLEAIAPYQRDETEVATALIERFETLAPRIVQAGIARAGDSWVDDTLFNLSGLISVRRAPREGIEGDNVDAAVARAQFRLQQGDLAGAVAELEPLSLREDQAEAWRMVRPWVEDARARVLLDRAATQLTDLATRRLDLDPAPGASP